VLSVPDTSLLSNTQQDANHEDNRKISQATSTKQVTSRAVDFQRTTRRYIPEDRTLIKKKREDCLDIGKA
jgi:hypothetical protein